MLVGGSERAGDSAVSAALLAGENHVDQVVDETSLRRPATSCQLSSFFTGACRYKQLAEKRLTVAGGNA